MSQGVKAFRTCVTCKRELISSRFARIALSPTTWKYHEECKDCKPKRAPIMKTCTMCGETKPRNASFSKDKVLNIFRDECRECRAPIVSMERSASARLATKTASQKAAQRRAERKAKEIEELNSPPASKPTVANNNPFLWRTYVPYQSEAALQASGRN